MMYPLENYLFLVSCFIKLFQSILLGDTWCFVSRPKPPFNRPRFLLLLLLHLHFLGRPMALLLSLFLVSHNLYNMIDENSIVFRLLSQIYPLKSTYTDVNLRLLCFSAYSPHLKCPAPSDNPHITKWGWRGGHSEADGEACTIIIGRGADGKQRERVNFVSCHT